MTSSVSRMLLDGFGRSFASIRAATKRASDFYSREGWYGVRFRLARWATALQRVRLPDGATPRRGDYSAWLRRYDLPGDHVCGGMERRGVGASPMISVIMPVYNPDHRWLIAAIESVCAQCYPHWELCIADDASTDAEVRQILEGYSARDPRIRIALREKNGHISAATNTALGLASGAWVAFLDQDDLLAEHALCCVARVVSDSPGVQLIYSDEDVITEDGYRKLPYFKSDWNPDLFLTHNMLCHLTAYAKSLIDQVGGLRLGLEGAQDYDLALRCIERIDSAEIHHVPRIFYHWRAHSLSTATGAHVKSYALEAGERALNDHLRRTGVAGTAELGRHGYHIRYELPANPPLVTLIIPVTEGRADVATVIQNVFDKTSYGNLEMLVVAASASMVPPMSFGDRVRLLLVEQAGVLPVQLNAAVNSASGEYIGLLHGVTDVLTPSWLDEMVGLALQPGVGAVGACLRRPNGAMHHGPGIVDVAGVVGYAHPGLPRGNSGYYSRAQRTQAATFVSTDGMIISRRLYQEAGGLDESLLYPPYCAADFGLRLGKKGLRSVWTPHAELGHAQRGATACHLTCKHIVPTGGEADLMRARWGKALRNDFAYNPNLSVESESMTFTLAWPPRLDSQAAL